MIFPFSLFPFGISSPALLRAAVGFSEGGMDSYWVLGLLLLYEAFFAVDDI